MMYNDDDHDVYTCAKEVRNCLLPTAPNNKLGCAVMRILVVDGTDYMCKKLHRKCIYEHVHGNCTTDARRGPGDAGPVLDGTRDGHEGGCIGRAA